VRGLGRPLAVALLACSTRKVCLLTRTPTQKPP